MIRRVEMNPLNSIASLVFTVLVLVGLFFLVKGFFTLLGFLTPALLIGAAILNWRVFPDYAKWVWNQLKTNLPVGVISIVLSAIFFPVLAGFLCFKAYMRYKSNKTFSDLEQDRENEFIDYEEVDVEHSEPFELPPLEKTKESTEYDGLFE
ncbi:MAG: hypothetical protein HKN16_03635 [Saprospiraceae bacterium]|nr:hypothetical protein [Saprospiraceae bacterium]